MYLEMSQPFNDPSRIKKVNNRLNLFESEFNYDLCSTPEALTNTLTESESKFYNNPVVNKVLLFVDEYITQSKILHYGSKAYNFYIKGHKYQSEPVLNYEVYTNEDPDGYYLDLLEKLKNKFTKADVSFKLSPRIMYWKDIDSDNYDIMYRLGNTNYKHLITFTRSYECMPYIQYNGVRYASFDRIKYNYYRGATLPDIINMCEYIPRNYKCLLKNLLELEDYLKKKNKTLILSGKFQPFRKECIGGDVDKYYGNLLDIFGNNVKMSKKTKMYIDAPKKGFITKVYPVEKEKIAYVYRPAEKKTKYYNKLIKFMDSNRYNTISKSQLGTPLFGDSSIYNKQFKLKRRSRKKRNIHLKKKRKLKKSIRKKLTKRQQQNVIISGMI